MWLVITKRFPVPCLRQRKTAIVSTVFAVDRKVNYYIIVYSYIYAKKTNTTVIRVTKKNFLCIDRLLYWNTFWRNSTREVRVYWTSAEMCRWAAVVALLTAVWGTRHSEQFLFRENDKVVETCWIFVYQLASTLQSCSLAFIRQLIESVLVEISHIVRPCQIYVLNCEQVWDKLSM